MQESSVFFKTHDYEPLKRALARRAPLEPLRWFLQIVSAGGGEVVRCGDGRPVAVGYGGCGVWVRYYDETVKVMGDDGMRCWIFINLSECYITHEG